MKSLRNHYSNLGKKCSKSVGWKIGEEILEEVEKFKYLGVWVDRKQMNEDRMEESAGGKSMGF